MQKKYDFVVVGSGIAGMSFALKVAHKGSVALLCKTELTEANTMLAQGGISSVTNYILDNYEKHIEDTLIAGDGICDPRSTCTRRADTPNFGYCTTKTLPVPRYKTR